MALDVKWSKQADKKFDKVIAYLMTEWGQVTTRNFIRKVYHFLDILSEYPGIGTIENKEKGIRGILIVRQVSLFYRIKDNTIIILDFFDNRQNPDKKRI